MNGTQLKTHERMKDVLCNNIRCRNAWMMVKLHNIRHRWMFSSRSLYAAPLSARLNHRRFTKMSNTILILIIWLSKRLLLYRQRNKDGEKETDGECQLNGTKTYNRRITFCRHGTIVVSCFLDIWTRLYQVLYAIWQ